MAFAISKETGIDAGAIIGARRGSSGRGSAPPSVSTASLGLQALFSLWFWSHIIDKRTGFCSRFSTLYAEKAEIPDFPDEKAEFPLTMRVTWIMMLERPWEGEGK